jgi:hypothetical protein
MGQLNNTQLQVIADKLARFATESVGDPEFSNAFNAGMQHASNNVLSGSGAIAAYLLTLNDEDIEADLLPPARDLDETHPTPADGFLLQITGVTAMIKALDTHFKRNGFKGVDDYLTQQNAVTPTLRFHGHFKKYLKTISAKNSFIPNDMDIATFNETGAAAGTYAHVASISPAQYAGAKLVVKNVTALTTSAVVTVTAKKLDGTTSVLTATLSTHTINAETQFVGLTTKSFIDVTAISITTGTAATSLRSWPRPTATFPPPKSGFVVPSCHFFPTRLGL